MWVEPKDSPGPTPQQSPYPVPPPFPQYKEFFIGCYRKQTGNHIPSPNTTDQWANYRDDKMSFYTIYCSNLISYYVCRAWLPDLVPVATGRGGADRPDHAAAAAGQSFSQVWSFVFFSRSYTRMAVFFVKYLPSIFSQVWLRLSSLLFQGVLICSMDAFIFFLVFCKYDFDFCYIILLAFHQTGCFNLLLAFCKYGCFNFLLSFLWIRL